MKNRLTNIGTALSQLLHIVLTLGGGDPKMTTSARIGRQVKRGERWAEILDVVISILLIDYPDHCLRAYEADKARRTCGGDHDR